MMMLFDRMSLGRQAKKEAIKNQSNKKILDNIGVKESNPIPPKLTESLRSEGLYKQ